MFSVGFWQLFEQMANCSASQVSDLFGSSAILGSFEESFLGFSEEARTRGFPSPSFGGFGFIVIVCTVSVVARRQIAMLPNDGVPVTKLSKMSFEESRHKQQGTSVCLHKALILVGTSSCYSCSEKAGVIGRTGQIGPTYARQLALEYSFREWSPQNHPPRRMFSRKSSDIN